MGRRCDRHRDDDRYRNFSEAGGDGPRSWLDCGRLRGMDRRWRTVDVRRAQFRRTRSGNTGSRRRVRLPAPRIRSRVGISIRMDAFNRRPPVIRRIDRRRIDAICWFFVSSYRCADLYTPLALAFFLEPSFRVCVYLGAAACRSRAYPADFHQLSWRAPGWTSPDRTDDYQDHFGCGNHRLRVLSLARTCGEFSAHLANLAILDHNHRFSRGSRRGAMGV